jgi:hypothetical protein
MLTGVDRRLTYRPDAATAPVIVELSNLQDITFGRRFLLEALAVVPLSAVLAILAPALRPVTTALSLLAVIVAVLWRRYFLVLRWRNGESSRWPLGTARIGSQRAQRIDGAWSSAAPLLATRGVGVRDGTGASGPRA